MNMETQPPAAQTRKRCPNGFIRNKKTGECEPKKNITLKKLTPVAVAADVGVSPVAEMPPAELLADVSLQPHVLEQPITENRVHETEIAPVAPLPKKRCPNGFTRNKKTGECEPKKNATIKIRTPVPPVPPVTETVVLPPTETILPRAEKPIIPPITETVVPPAEENVVPESLGIMEAPPTPTPISLEDENKNILNEPPTVSLPLPPPPPPPLPQPTTTTPTPPDEYEPQEDTLYPTLDDPDFSLKIAKMKEFYSFKYDGAIVPIEERAKLFCNARFELMPHQIFIRNFLSANTPYKSLLLYNMLGSGKTCTAIGVAEEMRQFMKKIGARDKILVVASPNVQANFKLQLFDDRKLVQIKNPANPTEYVWNIESCIGNSMLKEINPDNIHALPREKIISNINAVINQNYHFMGYGQLGKFLELSMKRGIEIAKTEKEMREIEIKNIRRVFSNRFIIIDEVHNIRLSDDNKNKTVAALLMKVAKHAYNMRLLLLSATPMFNSYKEIIWLTNLMNLNDKRPPVELSQIFDQTGNWKKAGAENKEDGRAILARKLTGYISYVRGENPYSFPYRIYPDLFSPEKCFKPAADPETSAAGYAYPTTQMNTRPIETPIKHVKVHVNELKSTTYQHGVYNYIMDAMKNQSYNFTTKKGIVREMPSFENMEKFGYTVLQTPLECLNMVYPNEEMEEILKTPGVSREIEAAANAAEENEEMGGVAKSLVSLVVGRRGLSSVMNYKEVNQPVPMKTQYEYKPAILKKYGRIFSQEKIGNYSHKISTICESIRKSTGVVLIYSQFIDGGVVPLALALEEMGFARHSSNVGSSLFKTAPGEAINYKMQTRSQVGKNGDDADNEPFIQAKYIMITGDRGLSLNNTNDVKYATSADNVNGAKVKVVIISKTGSESIDFKNIRQVHILEPWYNMNRMEQIVGRGVRNLSHCSLPFAERNVQIFYHSTVFSGGEMANGQPASALTEEPADLYVYRLAETKALQIGNVTRLLKETSVDCVLNIGQSNFTLDKLLEVEENQKIKQHLSTGEWIDYKVGDRPYTDICDYMGDCEYKCNVSSMEVDAGALVQANYGTDYALANVQHIAGRVKQLYKDKYVYSREELIKRINFTKEYPVDEIFFTLKYFIEKQDTLVDVNGRIGYLVNRGKFYLFQPVELTNENATMFERMVPIDYKRTRLELEVPAELRKIDKSGKLENVPVSNTRVVRKPAAAAAVAATAKTVNMRDEMPAAEEKPEIGQDQLNKSLELYKETVASLANSYRIASNPTKSALAKEKDWYKHCATVYSHLREVYELDDAILKKYIVYHGLDILTETDHISLLDVVYGDVAPLSENEDVATLVKQYFDEKIMRHEEKKKMAIYLVGANNSVALWIREGFSGGEWEKGDEDDYSVFRQQMQEKYGDKLNAGKLNNIVGFISEFKKQECVFKVKNMEQKRNNVGAKCDSAGKLDIIRFLNELVGERYTSDNVAAIKQPGLCVMLEIIMREYSRANLNGKMYYLEPVLAGLLKVSTL